MARDVSRLLQRSRVARGKVGIASAVVSPVPWGLDILSLMGTQDQGQGFEAFTCLPGGKVGALTIHDRFRVLCRRGTNEEARACRLEFRQVRSCSHFQNIQMCMIYIPTLTIKLPSNQNDLQNFFQKLKEIFLEAQSIYYCCVDTDILCLIVAHKE